jgi:hypothetical protein
MEGDMESEKEDESKLEVPSSRGTSILVTPHSSNNIEATGSQYPSSLEVTERIS